MVATQTAYLTLAEARGLPDLAHSDYPDLFAAMLAR